MLFRIARFVLIPHLWIRFTETYSVTILFKPLWLRIFTWYYFNEFVSCRTVLTIQFVDLGLFIRGKIKRVLHKTRTVPSIRTCLI